LREAPKSDRPLGLFPEGVAGAAGKISQPLPGVERLLFHLAQAGMPVVPAGISENGCLRVRFGQAISAPELVAASDPAQLAMQRVAELI
jgi:hypothetical protein